MWLQRTEHLDRMQLALRLRGKRLPRLWPVGQQRACFGEPRAVASGGTADQRLARGTRVGDAGEHDAVAFFADGTIDQRRLGIDDDPAAAGIDRRWRTEPQGEVERLAEQDDQIGAADRIGERAEGGVVEAAGGFP